MTTTDELPPFETRLLATLTDVVEERRSAVVAAPALARPRRTRAAVATAGVAAVALALVVAPGVTGGNGARAFDVRELQNGHIEVYWDRHLRDGRALQAELQEVGVDVEIVPTPASPSAVGSVVSYGGPALDEPGFEWGRAGSELVFTIDPEVFRGTVELHLAVEAMPGETYDIAEPVFQPGEILGGLHCAIGEPVRTEQLVPHLDGLGVDVIWETVVPDPAGDPAVAVGEEVDEVPTGQVLWGHAQDPETVRLHVLPDGASLDAEHYPPRISDVPCTPEQAAVWE